MKLYYKIFMYSENYSRKLDNSKVVMESYYSGMFETFEECIKYLELSNPPSYNSYVILPIWSSEK